MSELLSVLAERVEKLTGPCRETDALIEIALNIRPDWAKDDPAHLISEQIGRVSLGRHGAAWGANDYTGSLDAAVMLAVDGYYIIAIHQMPKGWVVKIGSRSNDQEPVTDVEHDSLPITLCSAWLLARAGIPVGRQPESPDA